MESIDRLDLSRRVMESRDWLDFSPWLPNTWSDLSGRQVMMGRGLDGLDAIWK
jgi:hypothetical protein